jgi:hypothetical protein
MHTLKTIGTTLAGCALGLAGLALYVFIFGAMAAVALAGFGFVLGFLGIVTVH